MDRRDRRDGLLEEGIPSPGISNALKVLLPLYTMFLTFSASFYFVSIGTGVYLEDVEKSISLLTRTVDGIFLGVFGFTLVLSLYITRQVIRMERNRKKADQAKNLEQMRRKGLFNLSQMTDHSSDEVIAFALKEAAAITASRAAYLAVPGEDTNGFKVYTWPERIFDDAPGQADSACFDSRLSRLWEKLIHTGRPLVTNHRSRNPESGKKEFSGGDGSFFRLMTVPIFDGDDVRAMAGAANKATDYDDADIRQLRLLTAGLWRILEKNRAQAMLRENEARYRIIADNVMDLIWTIDIQSLTITYVSPALERLLGYTPEEYLGHSAAMGLTRESLQRLNNLLDEELAKDTDKDADPNRCRTVEVDLVKKDGSLICGEITARFIRTEAGTPDKVLGITRDISRQRALERRLKNANTELNLAQKIAGIGSWSFNLKTGEISWSDEVFRIHERSPKGGVCGLDDIKALYVDDQWDLLWRGVGKAVSEAGAFDHEFKLLLPSGKTKWVQVICQPGVSGDSRTSPLIRGTVQDINQRKKMEDHMRQKQKLEALGTLSGGIAHDFNNILSSIIGFADLAKRKAVGNPDVQNYIEQVILGGLRARDLVRHILVFSRKAEVKKIPMEITPLAKECLKFLRVSLPHNITIEMDLCSEPCRVLADPTQIHQVLMNLFTNAVQAMKETGGILNLTLKILDFDRETVKGDRKLTPGRYILIAVSDTGCGIPKPIIPKIFEPFFTTKARGEGTGMGLSLVYGIVREMSGILTVDSQPGRGTTFEVLLPEETVLALLPKAPSCSDPGANAGRILLVEDEPANLAWTSQALSELGYTVVTAKDGFAALELFAQDTIGFDLIFTDLSMPGITGLEMAERIRHVRTDLPIILCTGFCEGLSREEVSARGITDIILKPVIFDDLSTAVHNALTLK